MSHTPHSPAGATADDCCTEFARAGASRRRVLQGALGLGGAMAVTQLFGDSVMQSSYAGTQGGNVLVVLSLRGGIDGLGVVVPHGDAGYYRARPTTAVPKDQVVCADAMFGLHPKMAPLAPFWASGELAAIQAVGLPAPNRSHFSAIEEIEDAAPGSEARSGWVNRMIGMGPSSATGGILDAVQLGLSYPTTALSGERSVMATSSLDRLSLPGLDTAAPDRRYGSLSTAWAGATGPLARSAADAVTVSRTAGSAIAGVAAGSTAYPTVWNADPFAAPLKSAAKLIRADLGTDVIAIDAGSWDYHTGYGTTGWGSMQSSIDGLARSLAAFLTDLGPLRSRVTVVTISEFGRRVQENGSQGFDHGWGNMMLVAGAGVKGGRYYGRWPGLGAAELAEGDLKVTTDYRQVLGEVLGRRFPDRSLATVFPGVTPASLGFMA
ncbi:DUF1501 domain-containing protein [Nocardioides aurantiacus]|uniref:DUF1501 domain-containing protein n=1 Tax=Nocardioides aurantiacus TaxID=86796 RepID=UPI00403F942A